MATRRVLGLIPCCFEAGAGLRARAFADSPTFFPPPPPRARPVPNIESVIAVASGKGGVGKSTTAVNLAVSLAHHCGLRVGLLDADVYGPSIPTMMNLHGITPQVSTGETGSIIPLENHGIKCMSMGFLVKADQAIAWRGPMVGKALERMIHEVVWGALDVLIVDLPPGTGDTHISLIQRVVLSGAVIVTTPQEVALADVRRSVDMLQKVKVPILGLVENMSVFVCGGCGSEARIFGSGGGAKLTDALQLPMLGSVPLEISTMEGSEKGSPSVLTHPTSRSSRAFAYIAERLMAAVQSRKQS